MNTKILMSKGFLVWLWAAYAYKCNLTWFLTDDAFIFILVVYLKRTKSMFDVFK